MEEESAGTPLPSPGDEKKRKADGGGGAAITGPFDVAVHHRIGGPDEQAGALADPVNAEKNENDSGDGERDLQG